MSPSERVLDRQTLRLIRKIIRISTNNKKKYFETWDRSQLLVEGYSERAVAKARQYDVRESAQNVIWTVALMCFLTAWISAMWSILWIIVMLLLGIVHWYRRRSEWLSPTENLRLLNELKGKFGDDFLIVDVPALEEHPILELLNRRLENYLDRMEPSGKNS